MCRFALTTCSSRPVSSVRLNWTVPVLTCKCWVQFHYTNVLAQRTQNTHTHTDIEPERGRDMLIRRVTCLAVKCQAITTYTICYIKFNIGNLSTHSIAHIFIDYRVICWHRWGSFDDSPIQYHFWKYNGLIWRLMWNAFGLINWILAICVCVCSQKKEKEK